MDLKNKVKRMKDKDKRFTGRKSNRKRKEWKEGWMELIQKIQKRGCTVSIGGKIKRNECGRVTR